MVAWYWLVLIGFVAAFVGVVVGVLLVGMGLMARRGDVGREALTVRQSILDIIWAWMQGQITSTEAMEAIAASAEVLSAYYGHP